MIVKGRLVIVAAPRLSKSKSVNAARIIARIASRYIEGGNWHDLFVRADRRHRVRQINGKPDI
ncbi:hypothetical protein LR1_15000 [Lacticaseibacillus rhamnosus DSM 20021 = JCM 1136 = NBRC 3425]|nr:hypothetical protein LR1_15000 [Lacticaseibacillus rhamnosus DSM 20021 = JCM 1136 = NBRC 3425]